MVTAISETRLETEHLHTLSKLAKSLDFADGFTLFFAQCNSPLLRNELIYQLKGLLEDKNIQVIDITLEETIGSLLKILRKHIKGFAEEKGKRFVFSLQGFEKSISSTEEKSESLEFLNIERESFQKEILYPLIIWLPEYALREVARVALDFWSWRSGVFEFSEEKWIGREVLLQYQSMEPSFVLNLSAKEKKKRMKTLERLLEKYSKLEESVSDKRNVKRAVANILYDLGIIYQALGDYRNAISKYNQSLKISEELEDKNSIAATLHQLGIIYQNQGDYPRVMEKYNQSLKIREELGDKNGIASTLYQLGNIYYLQGDHTRAIEKYNQSLNIAEELGDQNGISYALNQLGIIYQDQGDFTQAMEKYNQSLKIKEELGDKMGVAPTLLNLGNIYFFQGNRSQAIEKYNLSLKISKELGDKSGIAIALHNLGIILQDQGDYTKAIEKYNQSLKIKEELEDKSGIANTLYNLGMIHQNRGDYTQAIEKYNQSLKTFEELGNKRGIAYTLHQFGKIKQEQEDYRNAIQNYLTALSIFEELMSPYRDLVKEDLERVKDEIGKEKYEEYFDGIKNEGLNIANTKKRKGT